MKEEVKERLGLAAGLQKITNKGTIWPDLIGLALVPLNF
jgi:hypothetical protein